MIQGEQVGKRRAKRILGNDRGLMMICRDIRRRWMQYGENRQDALEFARIANSGAMYRCVRSHSVSTNFTKQAVQVDHVERVGSRPRTMEGLCTYAVRMFTLKCQVLCKKCHAKKTKREREKK